MTDHQTTMATFAPSGSTADGDIIAPLPKMHGWRRGVPPKDGWSYVVLCQAPERRDNFFDPRADVVHWDHAGFFESTDGVRAYSGEPFLYWQRLPDDDRPEPGGLLQDG